MKNDSSKHKIYEGLQYKNSNLITMLPFNIKAIF